MLLEATARREKGLGGAPLGAPTLMGFCVSPRRGAPAPGGPPVAATRGAPQMRSRKPTEQEGPPGKEGGGDKEKPKEDEMQRALRISQIGAPNDPVLRGFRA